MLPIVILYIQCIGNDGDVIANLDPRMYTLMVNATSNDIPPQFASDVVGPITVSGRSAQGKCNIPNSKNLVIILNKTLVNFLSTKGASAILKPHNANCISKLSIDLSTI